MPTLPDRFESAEMLEDVMCTPPPELARDLDAAPGDIIVLGVGGKMGPTVARMAKRAVPERRVIGVARFTEPGLRESLERHGVECIAADLLDRAAIARLPGVKSVPNVVFMAGRKFGSTGREDLTWAMNGYVPALIGEAYAGARIVAFSTACVYAFADWRTGGATESAPLTPPGEYANSCVARERLLQYWSNLTGTPGRLLRLSYSIDMRYGVLHDIGRRILAREPIDLAMGHVNVIWQGDAARQALGALAHCTTPTSGLNVSGPITPVHSIAVALGRALGIAPEFTGREGDTAWLINTSAADRLFGAPSVSMDTMIGWTAAWLTSGGASYDKATHFETRDGAY